MGTILRQALPTVNNAFAQQAQQAQADMAAPVAPMFNDAQVSQRRNRNNAEYQWGLLGAMMGDEAQQRAGGMVLQQALANRGERVTDQGVFDPITGQMSVNPEYTKEKRQTRADRFGELSGQAQLHIDEGARNEAFQQQQQAAQFGQQNALAATQFANQKELEGMRLTGENERARIAAGAKAPTDPQAKAANFGSKMLKAKGDIDAFEAAGQQGMLDKAAGVFGEGARSWMNDNAQKRYRSAQDMWLTANLRPESGAVIGPEEIETQRRIYFPIAGENEQTRAEKASRRAEAEAQMVNAAGSAWAGARAASNAADEAALPTLAVSKVAPSRAPAASAPAPRVAPTSMLPRTRAAMAAPDPFAAGPGMNYGPTGY